MRCNEFDAHIDEMLSGILHPDANQHMQQCERCTSHYRARTSVQAGLRNLASVMVAGPSRHTDRAVMDAYRRLQQRRVAGESALAPVVPSARLFTFPSRSLAPAWTSRTWWSGAAAAAVVLAVFGSAVHLWNNVPTVSAPIVATAPATPVPTRSALLNTPAHSSARAALRPTSQRPFASSQSNGPHAQAVQSEVASAAQPAASQAASPVTSSAASSANPVLTAKAPARPPVAYAGGSNYESEPNTPISPNVAPVIRLASTGTASNVAQTASSTWPGYSNLMYCDPVVCSGPMQVVHIKVPVGQVKPNLGQSIGNTFVNAEVVVGPDGVARAIRVAN
jgi:hypothetical protein